MNNRITPEDGRRSYMVPIDTQAGSAHVLNDSNVPWKRITLPGYSTGTLLSPDSNELVLNSTDLKKKRLVGNDVRLV